MVNTKPDMVMNELEKKLEQGWEKSRTRSKRIAGS
jgi:hypothetical protein